MAGRRKINKDEMKSIKQISTKQGEKQNILSLLPVVILLENKAKPAGKSQASTLYVILPCGLALPS